MTKSKVDEVQEALEAAREHGSSAWDGWLIKLVDDALAKPVKEYWTSAVVSKTESGATPGPWSIKRRAAPCAHNGDIGIINDKGSLIAFVYARGTAEANARLIAKSPEMLDMLIKCRKEFAGLPHSLGYDFTHLPALNALIAEATGAALAACTPAKSEGR